MRKTSHDGGDSTSISSILDIDHKKIGACFIKSTRNSLKKRVNNFSHESDDTVIEPLLKDKEKTDTASQSAKYLIPKTKTELAPEKVNDVLKVSHPFKYVAGSDKTGIVTNGLKESHNAITIATTSAQSNNYMNTNVFASLNETTKVGVVAPKTQILVEIDGQKSSGHTTGPLIFTTAKIHSDGKSKQMEPVHVTTIPISSTIESNNVKAKEFDKVKIKSPAAENKQLVTIKPFTNDTKAQTNAPIIVSSTNKIPSYQPISISSSVIAQNIHDNNESTVYKRADDHIVTSSDRTVAPIISSESSVNIGATITKTESVSTKDTKTQVQKENDTQVNKLFATESKNNQIENAIECVKDLQLTKNDCSTNSNKSCGLQDETINVESKITGKVGNSPEGVDTVLRDELKSKLNKLELEKIEAIKCITQKFESSTSKDVPGTKDLKGKQEIERQSATTSSVKAGCSTDSNKTSESIENTKQIKPIKLGNTVSIDRIVQNEKKKPDIVPEGEISLREKLNILETEVEKRDRAAAGSSIKSTNEEISSRKETSSKSASKVVLPKSSDHSKKVDVPKQSHRQKQAEIKSVAPGKDNVNKASKSDVTAKGVSKAMETKQSLDSNKVNKDIKSDVVDKTVSNKDKTKPLKLNVSTKSTTKTVNVTTAAKPTTSKLTNTSTIKQSSNNPMSTSSAAIKPTSKSKSSTVNVSSTNTVTTSKTTNTVQNETSQPKLKELSKDS